jgi:integrase
MELLAEYLAKNVADDGGALVFAGDKGGLLHRGNFNKRVRWVENVAAIGGPGLHFHDLRHGQHIRSHVGAFPARPDDAHATTACEPC